MHRLDPVAGLPLTAAAAFVEDGADNFGMRCTGPATPDTWLLTAHTWQQRDGALKFGSQSQEQWTKDVLAGCGGFIQATSGPKQGKSWSDTLRMKLFGPGGHGFDPLALDCARVARHGFKDMDAFLSAMSSQEFVPMAVNLTQVAAALVSTPGGDTHSPAQRQRWAEIDGAVLGNVHKRCASYAATFHTPQYVEAAQQLQVELDAGNVDPGAANVYVQTLRREQEAAEQCMATVRGFLLQTRTEHDVDALIASDAGENYTFGSVQMLSLAVAVLALVAMLRYIGAGSGSGKKKGQGQRKSAKGKKSR